MLDLFYLYHIGTLLVQSDDICTNSIQSTLYVTIATIYLVDILDGAHTVGTHCRNQQRNSRTNIRRGHLCSTELAQYGLLLGAEKAWSEATAVDGDFERRVDALLYEREGAVACLREVSALQTQVSWKAFVRNYDKRRFDRGEYRRAVRTDVAAVQAQYEALRAKLTAQTWRQDAFRQELLLAAEGVCLMAELNARLTGEACVRCTDTEGWLAKFGSSWLKSSKPSELWRIEEVFRWCEAWRA